MKQEARSNKIGASKIASPKEVSPMLCTLTRELVTSEQYVHEIKFDGYRIIAYKNKKNVRLDSRSGLDYTNKYPPVVAALAALPVDCVLDGEVCALNPDGLPDFDTLQKPGAGTPLVFYAFDVIWLNGKNLMELSLLKRKAVLQEILQDNTVIRYSEHFTDPVALFDKMKDMRMEGIVSKHVESRYVPGQRGTNWYKTPTEMRQEYVIGGWVESEKGRPFASLLFGAYKEKSLHWVGHAGGGFKDKEMPGILTRLRRFEIKKKPFDNEVDYAGVVHWVKPILVANFKFASFTKSGRIRKPAIFLGFREDKPPSSVVQELVGDAPHHKRPTETRRTKEINRAPAGSNWPKLEMIKPAQSETMTVDNCPFTATDIERQVWNSVTKMQLLQYYHAMSGFILPHLHDRPQSLHLKPRGAMADGFYIKDMEGRQPTCASIFRDKRKHKKPGKRDVIDYLVCNNVATLLYMINLGCVDVNPWTSRTATAETPDYIVIDLDPSDNDFKKAIIAAQAAKEVLQKSKLQAFPKTSGKTGIHIYIPCRGFPFPMARSIAENICEAIQQLVPQSTTTVVSVSLRGDKLYLDPNQNDYADTVAAPYAVRPHHSPTVSTPLQWKEINERLDSSAFTIHNILERVQKKGDLFSGALEDKIARSNIGKLKAWF